MKRVFVVFNPVAGSTDAAPLRQAIAQHLARQACPYEIYETTGREQLKQIVQTALGRGFNLIVAAGGDGTVSGVADALARTIVPLGIIPTGTGNVLARELGIPLNIPDALELLTTSSARLAIDLMQVGDQFFFLNVSVGVSALMMRDTSRADKRRFGRIAYLWTGLKKLLNARPWRFSILIDDRQIHVGASEILIINSGALGEPALRWAPDIRIDDGQIEVCIIHARQALDYVRVAWNILVHRQRRHPSFRCLSARQHVVVSATLPLPVQADGEVIGQTPVNVQIAPGALHVIVPGAATAAPPSPLPGRSAYV